MGRGGQRARAVAKLRELKHKGIDTLVDLTVIGLGRYIPRVKAISDLVPEINIVVATGVYTYNDVPMFFHFRGPGTVMGGPEPMVEIFIREIREGIADTGVRAGILKCATDRPGITPGVERVLRAVAQAHRATGCPDHDAHPDTTRTMGTPSAAHLQGGRGRPLPSGDRPQRRHAQYRLSPRAHRERVIPGLRSFRIDGIHD